MPALFIPFGYPDYPEAEMLEHIEESKKFLSASGIDFVSTNSIIELKDCPEAVEIAKRDNWDYIIVLLATWIESPHVLNILSAADLETKPMFLWSHDNIYDENEKATISFGAIASAGVIRETFEEMDYRFMFSVGNPGDEKLSKQLRAFDRAARTIAGLKATRIGLFDYVSMGMYTGLADHIKVKKLFGTEIVHVNQYDVLNALPDADKAMVEETKARLRDEFSLAHDIEEELLDKTAAIYQRFKELKSKHVIDGISVKCQYEMSVDFGFSPCVALSVLGEELPVSCEGDIYLLLSQMVLHYISEKVTTYGDVLGFLNDGIICAACGFAPKCFMAPEKPKINKHTAICSGLMYTSPFKAEDVTVIRLANLKDGFKMHVISGRTEELNDFHEIGCPPYAGSVIRFKNKEVEDFKQEIMSQHYAIVQGDFLEEVKCFCSLMGIKII